MSPASFRERYGPWAVIAGAGEGLGAAWAAALSRRGLSLLLIDRNAEPVTTLAATLASRHGAIVEPIIADLGDADSLDRILRVCDGRECGLLVCNAAQSAVGEHLDGELAAHERMLAVNCLAPLRLSHHFGRLMRERGGGGIILTSSLSAFQGNPMLAHYAATKAYNLILAEGLWDECRRRGVDVIACCPGATLTPGYLATRSAPPRFAFPPEMSPESVVEEALNALGQRPSVIPGLANRAAAFVIQRLLPRRVAIEAMGRVGRTLRRN
jgi:short-subunit dehydrogenase